MLAYRLGLLPRRWHVSAQVHEQNAGFWLWRELVNDPRGYFRVSPMPTEEQLDHYYSKIYWTTFRGKGRDCLLRQRDLHHWREILDLFDGAAPASLFNFGAGHGGVSLLAAAAGSRVVNFDPGNQVDFPGIENAEDLTSDAGAYDLVYSSHTLEHVTDPEEVSSQLAALLKPGGRMFIEVPNCHPVRGVFPDRGVEPPHTLYFRREFFASISLKTLVLKTVDGMKSRSGPVFREDDGGRVIRYIAARNQSPPSQ